MKDAEPTPELSQAASESNAVQPYRGSNAIRQTLGRRRVLVPVAIAIAIAVVIWLLAGGPRPFNATVNPLAEIALLVPIDGELTLDEATLVSLRGTSASIQMSGRFCAIPSQGMVAKLYHEKKGSVRAVLEPGPFAPLGTKTVDLLPGPVTGETCPLPNIPVNSPIKFPLPDQSADDANALVFATSGPFDLTVGVAESIAIRSDPFEPLDHPNDGLRTTIRLREQIPCAGAQPSLLHEPPTVCAHGQRATLVVLPNVSGRLLSDTPVGQQLVDAGFDLASTDVSFIGTFTVLAVLTSDAPEIKIEVPGDGEFGTWRYSSEASELLAGGAVSVTVAGVNKTAQNGRLHIRSPGGFRVELSGEALTAEGSARSPSLDGDPVHDLADDIIAFVQEWAFPGVPALAALFAVFVAVRHLRRRSARSG